MSSVAGIEVIEPLLLLTFYLSYSAIWLFYFLESRSTLETPRNYWTESQKLSMINLNATDLWVDRSIHMYRKLWDENNVMREYDETSKNKYENKIEKCDQPVPGINSGQCRIGENRKKKSLIRSRQSCWFYRTFNPANGFLIRQYPKVNMPPFFAAINHGSISRSVLRHC